jgi:hypothetical protein
MDHLIMAAFDEGVAQDHIKKAALQQYSLSVDVQQD